MAFSTIQAGNGQTRFSWIVGLFLTVLGGSMLFLNLKVTELTFTKTLSLKKFEPVATNSYTCRRTISRAYDDLTFDKNDIEKYFLYSPSGGFSNQRTELEYGLLVADVLQRSLIIPKAARHTTWWTKYTILEHEDLVPMDIVFDFTLARDNFDFIITNKTALEVEDYIYSLARKLPENNNIELIKPRKRPSWRGRDEILQNLESKAKLLYLKGRAMYHPWFQPTKRDKVTAQLPYNICLRNMALKLIDLVYDRVDSLEINALHIRLGDYYKHGRAPSVRKLIAKMEDLGYTETTPIYIATEPKRATKFFRPLERRFKNIFYSSDFPEIMSLLNEQFSDKIVNDILGMVEQLVCVYAKRFIGTSYSNFSHYIEVMRNNSRSLFPEAGYS